MFRLIDLEILEKKNGSWFFRYIRTQVMTKGETGRVAFDDNGDRIYAEYDIINIKHNRKNVSVGQYVYSAVNKNNIFCSQK